MTPAPPPSPYRGLAPFGDDRLDALLFFGRERDCEVIRANLVASRLTVLYGASGVGKSSILRAGVAHRLRQEPGVAVLVASSWGSDPTAPLREARRAAAWAREVYLVLDQFEEYFLYHGGEDGPGSLALELPELLRREAPPVHVLLAVREDALAQLDAFKARIPGVLANSLRLARLDRTGARAAILGPLERWSELAGPGQAVTVEPGLVEAVLDQTAAGRLRLDDRPAGEASPDEIEAPYLQLVLERLWKREREQESRVLRAATLAELGGAESIVRAHLEDALGSLAPAEQDVAAAVFNQLVTPSGTKIAHRAADLAQYADVAESQLRPVLDALARERILRLVDGAADGGARFEIFHDVLAGAVLEWRARRRLERERQLAQRRHRRLLAVTVSALVALAAVSLVALYALVQRDRAQTQARVAQARELEARALGDLADDPQGSLAAALRASRLEPGLRAEAVLRTVLVADRLRDVLPARDAVAAVAYSRSGAFLLARDTRAVRVYDAASRRLLRTFGGGAAPTAALFLRDDEVLVGRTDGSLVAADPRSGPTRRVLGAGGGAVTSLAVAAGDGTVLVTRGRGPATLIGSAAPTSLGGPSRLGVLDAGGRTAALVGRDGRLRLYDRSTGRLLRVLPLRAVDRVAFAPVGRTLAVATHDGTTTLWEPRTGERLRRLADGGGSLAAVAFDPTGSLLATASSDGVTRVWRVADGTRLYFFTGHRGHGLALAWSPDGKLLADASSDGTGRLWAIQGLVEAGSLLATLSGPGSPVLSVAFNPAGSVLATGSADGATRIWDGHAEETLHALARADAPVVAAAYAPGGGLALAAAEDGGVELRDPRGRGLVATFAAAPPLVSAAFAGPSRIVTAGGETAELWRADGSRLLRLPLGARALTAIPSADGSVLLTVAGRVATLRRLPGGAERGRATCPARVAAAALAADGRRAALACADGGLRVVDGNGAELWRAALPETPTVAAFSGDGRMIAVGAGRAVLLFDVAGGRPLHTLEPEVSHAPVTAAAFDPDGKRILVARGDGDARIWSTSSGRQLQLLVGQFGRIAAAAWSSDGRWAATGGPISAVLWPADTGRLLFYLRGHARQVTAVSFAPDGRALLTGSADGTTRTYACNVCGDLPDLQRRSESRLARALGT